MRFEELLLANKIPFGRRRLVGGGTERRDGAGAEVAVHVVVAIVSVLDMEADLDAQISVVVRLASERQAPIGMVGPPAATGPGGVGEGTLVGRHEEGVPVGVQRVARDVLRIKRNPGNRLV